MNKKIYFSNFMWMGRHAFQQNRGRNQRRVRPVLTALDDLFKKGDVAVRRGRTAEMRMEVRTGTGGGTDKLLGLTAGDADGPHFYFAVNDRILIK